jgi:putative cell wall-binding protein
MGNHLKPSATRTRLSALAVGTSLAATGLGAIGAGAAHAADAPASGEVTHSATTQTSIVTNAAVPTLTETSRMKVHADLTGSFADTNIDPANSGVLWGDGTSSPLTIDPTTRALSVGDHTYTTAGEYTFVLYLVEQGANTSITNGADIAVGDRAGLLLPQSAHYGTSVDALYAGTQADVFDTNVTYSMNWGDGHTDTTTPGQPLSALPTKHVYATARATPYTAVLTVFNNGVDAAHTSQQISINANTVQASVHGKTTAPFTVTADLTGSSVDGAATAATYTLDWGDGTAQTPDTQTLNGVGGTLPANPSHKYSAAGSYTIKLTVKDGLGGTATASTTQVVTAPQPTAPPVTQYAGGDRYTTSLLASQARWTDHGAGADQAGRVPANAVVLATGTSFPDALSGVPLAKAKKGPLLLTDGKQTSVAPTVLTEIQRILPKGGAIYVLGQTGAITQGIQDQLSRLGYHVTRYGGADRYATSLQIAQLGMNNPSHIVVARGDQGEHNTGFADALSAGPFAADVFGGGDAAVVLSDDDVLAPDVAAYVKGKFSGSSVNVVAVGGAAVSAVGALPGAATAARQIAGKDRYDTARLVAQMFALNAPIGVATGLQFPDAMTGGAYMASVGGPLILTDPSSETAGVGGTSLAVLRVAGTTPAVSIFGGDAAVSPAVVQAIMAQVGQSKLTRVS